MKARYKVLSIIAFALLGIVLLSSISEPIIAQFEVGYNITINVSPLDALYGEPITVQGSVNSSLPLPIKVSFYEYTKDIHEYAYTTATEGNFQVQHTPSIVGYWKVTALVDDNVESYCNTVEVVVRFSSSPPPSWEDGSSTVATLQGAPIGFEEIGNYVRLNSTTFTVEFYKGSLGYNKIYDGFGNILVYDDRIVLEYLFRNEWKQRGTPTGISWVKIDDYWYNVTRHYTDYLGTEYNVTYIVKSDSPIKISITLKSGQTDTYRIAWYPSGITKTAYAYEEAVFEKTGSLTKHRIVFGDRNVDYGWIGFDWSDVIYSFGNITETSCEDVANGKKANIYFNLGVVEAGHIITVDPSVVGTSASEDAIYHVCQRKSFFSAGRFWVFYSDGTNMVYRTSTDGSTWSSSTTVRSCGYGDDFSIWYDGTYIHYAYAPYTSGCALYYRRGTPNSDGSITWSASEQTAISGNADVYIGFPNVAVDSNGYAWIAYTRTYGGNTYPYVTKSGNNDGTWGTTPSGFPHQLASTDGNWFASIIPLTSGKTLALYVTDYVTVRAKRWDGSSWGSEAATSGATLYWDEFSAVAQGDDVHLVFTDTSEDIIYTKYFYSSNSFSSETTIQDTSTSYVSPVLSIDYDTNDLYVFWAGAPTANHIYYRKYDYGTSTWEERVDWLDESSEGLTSYDRITGFYQAWDHKIGLVYMTGSASPYNVKFAYLSLNQPPTIGEFQAPNTIYAQKYAFINATINDGDGVADFVNATVTLTGSITLKWENATDTFSISSDPNNYAVLDTPRCTSQTVNSTAVKLSWRVLFKWNYPEGSVDVADAEVCDSNGASSSNTESGFFTFEDDVVVSGASVDDDRVNPSDNVTFSGSIYYQGTSTPPVSGNSALSFDGVDDYVKVANSPSLNFGTDQDFSIILWMKAEPVTTEFTEAFLDKRSIGRVEPGYNVLTPTNVDPDMIWVYIDDGTNRVILSADGVRDGGWHQIAVSADRDGDAVLYVDSVERDRESIVAVGNIDSTRDLTIGRATNGGRYLNGIIDEVRLYNRALSPEEIQQAYMGNPPSNGLVLHLDFDGTAEDKSGNGNDGTSYGPSWTDGYANLGVNAELSGSLKKGTSLVNSTSGSFIIPNVTVEDSIAQYNYNIYAEQGVQNQTVNLVTDCFNVKTVKVSDARVDVNSNVDLWFEVYRAYDDAVFDSTKGTVYVNGTLATWDSSENAWKVTVSQSAVTGKVYAISSISDTEYGISTINSALSFDGVDDYVDADFLSDVREWDSLTVSLWVKLLSTPDQGNEAYIGSCAWSIEGGFLVWTGTTGECRVRLRNDPLGTEKYCKFEDNVLNEWRHYIFVFDRPTLKTYVNGAWTGNSATWDYPVRTDGHITIGRWATYYQNCIIDEVRVYNRSLTEQEIKELYEGAYSNTTGLVLYLSGKMNGSTIYDESGQGNHGTIYGAVPDQNSRPSPRVIWDRIKVNAMTASDTRTDINSAVNVDATLVYEYDGSTVTDGTVTIEGITASHQGSGVWRISPSKSTVQAVTYNSIACSGNSYGITAVNMNGQSVTVIWDRLELYWAGASDTRIDVGGTSEIRFKVRYDYDDEVFDSNDGSLSIGGISATWDATNGWWEATITHPSSVTSTLWDYNDMSFTDNKYGITVKTGTASVSVITDKFEIVSVTASDTRINVGGTFELRYKIRYDYDDVTFDSSKGSVSGFTWDATNEWWEKTVTGSSSVTSTNYDETYISITDNTYGLTVKQDVAGVNVITDRIEVYYEALDDSRVDVNSNIEFRVKARLDYDNHELGSEDSIIANFGSLTWDATNGWFDGVRSQSSVGSYTFTVSSASESTYGITAIWINTDDPTGIWDRVQITLSVPDTRINVGANHGITYSGVYEYDGASWSGTATLNDTNTSYDTVGKRGFKVASITDPSYGLTAFTTNEVSVIWDRIVVYWEQLNDSRVNVGDDIEWRIKAVLDYDDHPLDSGDSLSCSWGSLTWDSINEWWEIAHSEATVTGVTIGGWSGSESTYGITAITENLTETVGVYDRIVAYWEQVDDTRLNVNDDAEWRIKAVLDYDDTPLGSGDSLSCSWGVLSWDDVNGWFEITHSEASVGAYTITLLGGSEATYDITAFTENITETLVVYDRIKLTSLSASDTRLDINSNTEIRATAVLEYDNHPLGSGDSLTIGGLSLTWDEADGRFEGQESKSTVQSKVYNSASGNEATYGITEINMNGLSVTVIWDRLEVYDCGVSDNRADVGSSVTYWWKLRYDYDDSVFDSSKGTVTIGGSSATWNSAQSRWERAVTLPSTPQSYSQDVGFTDDTYGLTEITGTTSQSVIADRLEVFWVGASDTRINIGASTEIRFKVRYDYDDVTFDSADGTLSIGGVSATWDPANNWWEATITHPSSVTATTWDVDDISFTDDTYGLTAKTGTASVDVITDRIKVYYEQVDDSRVNVNSNIEYRVKAVLEYDEHPLGSGDSLTANAGVMTWDEGNGWFDVQRAQAIVGDYTFQVLSGTESTYGISAITTNASHPLGIWDNLTLTNLQPVEFLGDGKIKYEGQIKYAYDGASISGASINVSLPSGTVIGQATSNSTGWFSVVLTQSNATESGTYTIYGVDDNVYGITVPGQNATFTLHALIINPKDVEGNSLSSTIMKLYNSTFNVVSPSEGITYYLPSGSYSMLNVTWHGFLVNSTSLNLSADTTLNLTCKAYPLVLSGTRYWTVSNATISNANWDSVNLVQTITFSGNPSGYVLFNNAPRPRYILNCTFNFDTHYSGGNLTLPLGQNTTVTLGYSPWGDFYIKSIDNGVLTYAGWTGYYFNLTAVGTGSDTIIIYCGGRGAPSSMSDTWTSGIYHTDTSQFVGTVSYASPVRLWLYWSSGTSSGTSGGGGGHSGRVVPRITFKILDLDLGEFFVGDDIAGNLTVNWSGVNAMEVQDVEFEKDWFMLSIILPKNYLKTGESGEATLPFILHIPSNLKAGTYSVKVVVKANFVSGTLETSGYVTFTVKQKPTVPENTPWVFITMLGLGACMIVLVGSAYGILKKRNRKT